MTPFGAGASLPAPEALEPWLKQQAWAGEPLVAGRAWRELKRVWKTHGNWTEFLAHLGWLQEAEMVRGKAEHVQIMTMHASKGLEFQAVFLPGLEEGLLPLRKDLLFGAGSESSATSGDKAPSAPVAPVSPVAPVAPQADEDEERRLLYVALTRAARALFVSHSARRMLFGKSLALLPSPFLEQIRQFCRQSALAVHKETQARPLSLLQEPEGK